MKILHIRNLFVISGPFLERGGANVALFLWKGCQLLKRLGTYGLRGQKRELKTHFKSAKATVVTMETKQMIRFS